MCVTTMQFYVYFFVWVSNRGSIAENSYEQIHTPRFLLEFKQCIFSIIFSDQCFVIQLNESEKTILGT